VGLASDGDPRRTGVMFQLRVGRNEPIEQRLHARLIGYWRSIATTAIADALEAPEYVDIEVVLLCSGEEPDGIIGAKLVVLIRSSRGDRPWRRLA
jgi:hypothetical protein